MTKLILPFLLCLAACSEGIAPTFDGAPQDDAAVGPDADPGVDLGLKMMPDTGVDLGVVPADAGVDAFVAVDAWMPPPDASTGDAWVPPSCDSLYGAGLDYVLCGSTDITCSVAVTLPHTASGMRTTCAAFCTSFGGTCLGADQNDPGTPVCDVSSSDTCTMPRDTNICLCSRS